MEKHNHTAVSKVTEFILLGLTDSPGLQAPLFGIFLVIYLVTVMGNLDMVILTHLDSTLHTPTYFFLRHLSITDLGYSTVIGPKMMVNFVVHKNTVSYYSCATQLAFFEVFIITELFILSAMAYDCYIAICKPLLYRVIMAEKVTEFILVGLTDCQEVKIPLFVLLLSIYLFTVVGNLGLILVIRMDERLNTPMYFFLSNLAFVDFCYASVITPKMLENFLYQQKVITFNACAAQLGCFLACMTAECLLLASMAYDLYVAICNTLL
ncbi:hypothetical protein CB1_000179001 [Camelus ferus]|nr:hypothetical protein CB1_000179001 [Camelus ferus]